MSLIGAKDPHSLYRAALLADAAWSEELYRLFGNRAGDVRYTKQGAGAPGSKLRRLCNAKLAADRALRQQGLEPTR
jgi:hypothetical protein